MNLFRVQQKSLKLQQTQEAGSIFINEVKNIVVTVVAATAVIQGHMTLGMMLAVQYIIGQLNSPVEQLMNFFYSVQDVKISLERINEIHQMDDENGKDGLQTSLDHPEDGIHISNIMFKYDPHALRKTIDGVDILIPQGKVTAIVGASGSFLRHLLHTPNIVSSNTFWLGLHPFRSGNQCKADWFRGIITCLPTISTFAVLRLSAYPYLAPHPSLYISVTVSERRAWSLSSRKASASILPWRTGRRRR